MSKAPSDKTVIRNLRASLTRETNMRVTLANDCQQLRTRLTIVEQERTEWKARFDRLLKLYGEASHDQQTIARR